MKSPSLFLCCLCSAGIAAPALAAPLPADELLRYVPRDVTFCMVLRDLRSHREALNNSPFADHLRRSPLGKALTASPQFASLLKTEQSLEKMLGVSLEKVRDEVLSESMVFAYRQGPPGKPEQEQGLVLLRAKEAKPLADLVDGLNAFLKSQGMLKEVREVEHGGFKYQRRVEGDEVNFLCLRGPVLIFSGQESLLREALALEKNTPMAQEAPVTKSLRQLGADRALLSAWINPRAFDAELAARVEKSAGAEKAFHKTFADCWKALDGAALTLSLTRELEMGLALRGRPESLPPEVRRLLEDASGRADLWARFPDDALLNLAARTPAPSLLAFLGAFQTKRSFESMLKGLNDSLGTLLGGRDVAKDVLPHVGPDWGVSVSAPLPSEKGWFPSAFFALRVAAGDNSDPVDKALVDLLKFHVRAAVMAHNKVRKDPLAWKTARHERLEMTYLASGPGLAMGLQPAFGLCDGYLVIASTPETFRRFAAAPRSAGKETEVPLLRLSFTALRQYLKDQRQPLASAIAEQHQQTPERVSEQMEGIAAVLGLFDRLELTQRTIPGQVMFTLRLRPSHPLRK
jgi:hypothetical protein